MPDCGILLEQLDIATDEYLTAYQVYWAKRAELQQKYSDFSQQVQEIDQRLDAMEEDEQDLLEERDALGEYDPNQTECSGYQDAWNLADQMLGAANAAWNQAYARYQLATEEYERLSEEWAEIYAHLSGARDRLDEVQAQIAELEPHEADDTSVPGLDELREERSSLEEEIALLEPMEAAAFAAAEAADRESAELMQPLDELEDAAIRAEEVERTVWEDWQACLDNSARAIAGAEIEAELRAIDSERGQLLNQRETASTGMKDYDMMGGSLFQEEIAEPEARYNKAIGKMFDAFNAAKAHGCIEGEAGQYKEEYDAVE
ncbi:hypothetical protein [Arenimonas sp.]|uniref:hypothetical protein n=1 Tax=Arenimonas sp. TaxID=1872635 RepID=UPI0039E2B6DD